MNETDMILELLRREKRSGINPDEDLDIFIKALAPGEQKTSLYAEYIMKILGLDTCADTLVGDEMLKGISGGQKKRLTAGELLVGTSRVLLMDEISTGWIHFTSVLEGTTVVSLLQPDPETYELFDDIILLYEGQIVYQGPGEGALDFFTYMGFRCPERKNAADFLQKVTSLKDQRQYWYPGCFYRYVLVEKFVEGFKSYRLGHKLIRELATPFQKHYNHSAVLSTSSYGAKKTELLKICFSWQKLLMKRNSSLYVFKYTQLLLVTLIIVTVFFRKTMHHNTVEDGGVYLGALYFSIVMNLFNGFMEVPMLIQKLPVLYKHRDLRFYPCWVYTLPSWILSIPSSLVESAIWVGVTYYLNRMTEWPNEFTSITCYVLFLQLRIDLSLSGFDFMQIPKAMSIYLFRVMASLGRNLVVANTFVSFAMLVVMALGGFILSRDSIPKWWIWGYWVSPLMYAKNAASMNEFLGHSWDKKVGNGTLPLGVMLLKARSLFSESYWYWIGAGALLGYMILFNILLMLFLTYLNPLGVRQAVIFKDKHQHNNQEEEQENTSVELGEYLQHSFSYNGKEVKKKGMVLPFQRLSMAFSNICYYVDVPTQGVMMDKLQLLHNVTGAFRPGILTALVGVSGAGKTTLMDVLSGRKTGGSITGSIYIDDYPKKQEIFARISGYCEQDDNHSPCLTVHESLLFSAWLRLSSHVDQRTQRKFVDEVMELMEFTSLSGALVGMPGVDELSTEQRKRLTIAVELV
ncbi:ABC transporter G family member 32, partial [Bienertia sinuspersici]